MTTEHRTNRRGTGPRATGLITAVVAVTLAGAAAPGQTVSPEPSPPRAVSPDADGEPTLASDTPLAAAEDAGPSLRLGDPMPPLDLTTWVQGPEFDSLREGQVWVVLCWATWTPVSRDAARGLSQLQTQWHTSARVVGVAWADESRGETLDGVRAYVESRDSFMRFPIAFDASGGVAGEWLEAAGAAHVPWVFVIDQQGTLAWHGGPNDPDLASVVDQVRAGEWDHEAYLADKAIEAEAQARTNEAIAAFHAGEPERCLELLQGVFDMDPGRFAQHALWKFQVMAVEMGQAERAMEYARDLADGPLADKPDLLANMAWIVILDPRPEGFDERFVEDMAERALASASQQHGHAWAAMAMVERRRGDFEASLEAWRRALLFVASDELEEFYLGLEGETRAQQRDSMGYGPPAPEGYGIPGN
ncbi:MAG: redoxin domain-containing protein [Phycisphaerales bacterium]